MTYPLPGWRAIARSDMSCGIYALVANGTSTIYVGSSLHVGKRFAKHAQRVKGGYHNNKRIQAAWRRTHGGLCCWMIEECEPADLEERERFWIARLEPNLNLDNGGRPVDRKIAATAEADERHQRALGEAVDEVGGVDAWMELVSRLGRIPLPYHGWCRLCEEVQRERRKNRQYPTAIARTA